MLDSRRVGIVDTRGRVSMASWWDGRPQETLSSPAVWEHSLQGEH